MADRRKRLARNVEGPFFVDSTCINCDTCRQLAPDVFAEADDASYVARQPSGEAKRRAAFRALVSCPTGSIGGDSAAGAREAAAEFPLPVEDGVYYCGFNSEKSFGGNSYFVEHPGGNWLIDSPRYTGTLVRRFEERGGIARVFLTHRDDVADAARYAEHFGAVRIIHRLERAAQPGAERIIEGATPVPLAPDFLAIPTPGHTAGHMVLLYRDRYLFTGDHLWWSRERGRLNASRSVCWYSWEQQASSMAALAIFPFEWVLPGHGQRVRLAPDEMAEQVAALAARMRPGSAAY